MKQQHITKVRMSSELVLNSVFTLLWFGLLFLVVILGERAVYAFLAATAIGLGCAWLVVLAHKARRQRRNKAIAAFAAKHKYTYDPAAVMGYVKGLGSIDDIYNARDLQVRNVIVGPDWTYCDFSYAQHNRIKLGNFKMATVYYGVMFSSLPRKVPHIFFDSIKARRRQFRFHFDSSQQYGLEGDFNKYFATYFPQGYHVDALSIISPDVMLALRDAQDYDIEIVGNKVLLYGPLADPEIQIPEMAAKLLGIKKELQENIDTYRDDRVPKGKGRQFVAPQGTWLKRSGFWPYITLVATILWFIFLYYIELKEQP